MTAPTKLPTDATVSPSRVLRVHKTDVAGRGGHSFELTFEPPETKCGKGVLIGSTSSRPTDQKRSSDNAIPEAQRPYALLLSTPDAGGPQRFECFLRALHCQHHEVRQTGDRVDVGSVSLRGSNSGLPEQTGAGEKCDEARRPTIRGSEPDTAPSVKASHVNVTSYLACDLQAIQRAKTASVLSGEHVESVPETVGPPDRQSIPRLGNLPGGSSVRRFEIEFTRESLGAIRVMLHCAGRDARVTVVVENETAKQAVLDARSDLHSALGEAGLAVREVRVAQHQGSVDAGSAGFGSGNSEAADDMQRRSRSSESGGNRTLEGEDGEGDALETRTHGSGSPGPHSGWLVL
jgi:hypothetical protein